MGQVRQVRQLREVREVRCRKDVAERQTPPSLRDAVVAVAAVLAGRNKVRSSRPRATAHRSVN